TWTGTVYIRADGSVDPSDAPIITVDNVTYTLTGRIASNANGIVVERDQILLDGANQMISGKKTHESRGIDLSGRINVTVKNVQIENFTYGILVWESSNCTILGNNLIGNDIGIALSVSSNNTYTIGNTIIANHFAGVWLYKSIKNTISRNNLTNDDHGIGISVSSNNSISENYIASNNYGIWLQNRSSDNHIYHNNFIDNVLQACISPLDMTGYLNIWDDGYPSGGNYWSSYNGTDVYGGSYQNVIGSDGIGDIPYIIDKNNTDRYPSMAPFNSFDVGVWDDVAYNVDIVSNSTISDFHFDVDMKSVIFNVNGTDGTIGFCRVTIPKSLLRADDGWTITVGDQTIQNCTELEDENFTYLYFTYNHSTQTVTIEGTWAIPEFPSTIILSLFTLTTLIATILLKKKRKGKPQLP
ncbi:hypothetical protein CW693_03645, partial [Candidatus Bathyarchaeota archaeon]